MLIIASALMISKLSYRYFYLQREDKICKMILRQINYSSLIVNRRRMILTILKTIILFPISDVCRRSTTKTH